MAHELLLHLRSQNQAILHFSGHDLSSKEPKIEFETNFHNHNGSTKTYISAYLYESCVQKSYTIDRFLMDD